MRFQRTGHRVFGIKVIDSFNNINSKKERGLYLVDIGPELISIFIVGSIAL
jgi:hypothetical protein